MAAPWSGKKSKRASKVSKSFVAPFHSRRSDSHLPRCWSGKRERSCGSQCREERQGVSRTDRGILNGPVS